MGKRHCLTILFWTVLLIWTQPSYSQTFFANNSDGNLISLDINGCTTSTVIGIGSYTDIATHPDGNLYAVKSNGQLFRINTASGTANLVSSFPGSQYYALTADSNGDIYAASGSGALASYNPTSNTSSSYPNMGYGASGDLTFYQGDMYMAATNNTMVRIDKNNPNNNVEVIDFSSANVTIFGIVSAVNGCDVQTYAISDDNSSKVYEIDWDNQAFNFVCTVPHRIYGGASEFEFNASADFITLDNIDIQADCGDTSANISITANSVNGGLNYSLNNTSTQGNGNFNNVAFGDYTVLLTDSNGCTKTEDFTVAPPSNITIDNIEVNDVTCGETNGSILVEASSTDGGILYSLDGINFSTTNFFENIPPDNYTMTIMDNSGCTASIDANITETTPIELLSVNPTPTSCGGNNGSINIEINDNGNTVFFSLDNLDFFTINSFNNLQSGNYTVYITDENDCLIQEDVTINPSDELILNDIEITLTDCGENNGVVMIDAFGGENIILNYNLSGTENNTGIFDELGAGEFEVNISTSGGCEIGSYPISIGDPCGIYIPNTFTPNEDGYNDVFKLYSPTEVQILELLIFDRWGGLIHRDANYSSSELRGWKGKRKGKQAPSEVFIYMFRIIKNGKEQLLKGDITVINLVNN
jgi:gliding motility-associated-like protein